MISSLKIQNLVLVEQADIAFGPNLNILTGESGAGKSAILLAIRLLAGDRFEAQMIREGAEMAVIEATFPSFVLRREMHRSGKGRCFLDDQLVPLSALRDALSPLLERVDQSSSLQLFREEAQRKTLDLFADLDLSAFSQNVSSLHQKQEELSRLQQAMQSKERELAWAQKDLQLILDANWQEAEEEKLFEQHTLLADSQNLIEKLSSIATALTETNLISFLKRSATSLDKLPLIAASLKTAALEAEEASRAIASQLDQFDAHPDALAALEKRLAAIETLKRKFGSFADVQKKKEALSSQIERLLSLETTIRSLEEEIASLHKSLLSSAQTISETRRRKSRILQEEVLAELRELNLPHAAFQIDIAPSPLSTSGADTIAFLFAANPGQTPSPLHLAASGGELSRLLLALKITLAQKQGASTLVFDEIDSNVGGQTAAILGEKLKRLSQNRQIICVTHFLQVARQASHHFRVFKQDSDMAARTLIEKLTAASDRQKEYNRMLAI